MKAKPIKIGDRFGRLVVKAMNPANGCYLCDCDCGNESAVHHNKIRYGRAKECKACKNQALFVIHRQIDRSKLQCFDPETANKIVRRYLEHLRVCAKNGVTSATFAAFVGELTEYDDLLESEPLEDSEGFIARLTHRRFDQYRGPKLNRKEEAEAA